MDRNYGWDYHRWPDRVMDTYHSLGSASVRYLNEVQWRAQTLIHCPLARWSPYKPRHFSQLPWIQPHEKNPCWRLNIHQDDLCGFDCKKTKCNNIHHLMPEHICYLANCRCRKVHVNPRVMFKKF